MDTFEQFPQLDEKLLEILRNGFKSHLAERMEYLKGHNLYGKDYKYTLSVYESLVAYLRQYVDQSILGDTDLDALISRFMSEYEFNTELNPDSEDAIRSEIKGLLSVPLIMAESRDIEDHQRAALAVLFSNYRSLDKNVGWTEPRRTQIRGLIYDRTRDIADDLNNKGYPAVTHMRVWYHATKELDKEIVG
jgi:hypothetical protein